MIIALWVAILILIVAVVLLLGAQIELLEQVKQMRRVFGLEDGSKPIELPEWVGRDASEAGLPELAGESWSLVLFISNTCATCHTLADGMRGGQLPEHLWVAIANVRDTGHDFQQEFALYGERIIVDESAVIMTKLGLSVTPVGLVLENGKIQRCLTIPSLHQLDIAMGVIEGQITKGVSA
jgi:hypothetical protein